MVVGVVEGDGDGEGELVLVNAANVGRCRTRFRRRAGGTAARRAPSWTLVFPAELELLDELPPSAMVVVPWAASSVKSAWTVSEMVPVAAVAVR